MSCIAHELVPRRVSLIDIHPGVECGHDRVGVAVAVARDLGRVDHHDIDEVLSGHAAALAGHGGCRVARRVARAAVVHRRIGADGLVPRVPLQWTDMRIGGWMGRWGDI